MLCNKNIRPLFSFSQKNEWIKNSLYIWYESFYNNKDKRPLYSLPKEIASPKVMFESKVFSDFTHVVALTHDY